MVAKVSKKWVRSIWSTWTAISTSGLNLINGQLNKSLCTWQTGWKLRVYSNRNPVLLWSYSLRSRSSQVGISTRTLATSVPQIPQLYCPYVGFIILFESARDQLSVVLPRPIKCFTDIDVEGAFVICAPRLQAHLFFIGI